MKTKKTLAILLAVMMILSSVPMLSLAAPIALKAANVTEWPTAIGEMYVGQKISEHITLVGGEVRYDANGDGVLSDDEIVPGHFEHAYEYRITASDGASDAWEADIEFVPDDTTAYKGFEKMYSPTTFVVKKPTPVLADENNLPFVKSEVAANTPLSQVVISGGAMINPYYENDTGVSKKTWTWVDPNQLVTESGEYDAIFNPKAISYEAVTRKIYIIVGDTNPTVYGEVTSWPTIECPDWTPGMTVADLSLKGGEATVEGTFNITNVATTALKPNTTTIITVAFTPADSEVEMTTATTKTFQVTPTFTVKDIVVESISPITIEYGKTLDKIGIGGAIVTNPADASVSFKVQENEDAGIYNKPLPVGEHTVKARVYVPSEYVTGVGFIDLYNSITIDVPIIVIKATSTSKFGSVGSQENVQEDGSVNMNISYRFEPAGGKFGYAVLKVNGETVVDNITDTTGTAYYSYNVRESGTYTATLEYVPAENDYIEYTETVLSKTVDITVDLKEEDPITPIIPGGDDEDDNNDNDNDNPDLDIDWGDLTDGSHSLKIVNIIKNLVEMLKAFIQQIGDFFSNLSLGNIIG